MILLVDNYDSFTYNLVHFLQELGADVLVRRTRFSRHSARAGIRSRSAGDVGVDVAWWSRRRRSRPSQCRARCRWRSIR